MRASEMLKCVLCNPQGKVCIAGSDGDREILKEAIKKVQEMERINNLGGKGE